MKKSMNIVLAGSKEYSKYASVLLLSLYKNNSCHIRVFYYYDEEMEEELQSLIELTEKYNNEFIPMYVSKEKVEALAEHELWHASAWYRWFSIEDLRGICDRALLLGIDMIITGDISEYYEQHMDGKPLAMVVDASNMYEWYPIFDECEKKGKNRYQYVNPDSCLMDIGNLYKVMTVDDMMKKYSNDKVYCMDQGILNYYYADYIKVVNEYTYNFGVNVAYDTMEEDSYRQALDKAVVWHYGGRKPWNAFDNSYAHKKWLQYAIEAGVSFDVIEGVIDGIIDSDAEKIKNEQDMKNRFMNNYQVLESLWNCIEQGEQLERSLLEKGLQNIAIYGAGTICRHLVKYLNETDVKVRYILDAKTEGEIFGIRSLCMDKIDSVEVVDAIIVTPITYYEEIKEQISQKGEVPVISINDIMDWRTV